MTYYGKKLKKKKKKRFMSVVDEDSEGRPPFVVTENNVIKCGKKLFLLYRHISLITKQLSRETGISVGVN